MRTQYGFRETLIITVVFILCWSTQANSQSKKKAKLPSQTPKILWREPTDIGSRDLFWGPGGERMRPDASRIIFIEEQKGGYSKKYRVRDAKGREWVAKLGKEAQSETVAVRLVWAVGYVSEINYLLPRVTIEGKGTFENVRFEARPANVERLNKWEWKQNPFVGKREFQGLKILMALMENWDLKDSNNKVLRISTNGRDELHYIVSDLGATFGKTGGQKSPIAFLRKIKGSRNEPDDYVSDEFIDEIRGNQVRLDYSGKNSSIMRDITTADARWIGSWLSRLSERQIQAAFRAANYSPEEVRMLAEAVRNRIRQLMNLRPEPKISD